MFNINRQAILGSARTSVLASGTSFSPGTSGFNVSGTIVHSDFNFSLLDGFIDINNKDVMYKTFREMYMLDAVTGPAIDQLSSLPWSSYSIIGVEDPNVLRIYGDCLSELNLIRLMTYLSTCYLVLGIAIGSLVFDKSRGIFSDCILYNPDLCQVTPIPMVGYDPKIDLKISKEMRKFLASKDVRDIEALKEIPLELQQQLRSGSIPLEPITTLILNRSSLPGIETLSYLSRVLPIWLVEKALTRGTLLASTRRQRSVLHVTCLTGDTLIDIDGKLSRLDSFKGNTPGIPVDVDFTTLGFNKRVKVNKWIYQGEKQVFRLTTKSGYSIKATADHKFLTVGNSLRINFKQLSELGNNDYLVVSDKYDKIQSIEKLGIEKTYDISIDTSEGDKPVFVANGIMVHNCGSDEWEPTDEQYQQLGQLIANSDRDPQGAVIVTRPDVSISEFRSPTDFWGISNERDGFTQLKLRALGLNDSWGTDSNYSVQENSMTMFLENINNFRNNLTKSVIYDKIFLLLAKYHGFRRRTKAELQHNVRYSDTSNHAAINESIYKRAVITGSRNLAESATYIIPELKWSKSLEPRGDSAFLGILQSAKELGLPVPIALVSACAGIPINTLIDSLKQDISYRKEIKTYNDELAKLQPKEDDGGGMFGSVKGKDNIIMHNLRTQVQTAKDIAKIKDTNMLKTYLYKNMPPNVSITSNEAKQILNFANSIKPGIVAL